jgi:hypothetical protein
MVKFRTLRIDHDLDQLEEMLQQRKLQLLHEKSPLGDQIFVLSPRGEMMGRIDPARLGDVAKMVARFGSQDGLFPGYSQTTAIGKPLPSSTR